MSKTIRRVRMGHARVVRSYQGASGGGWTTTLVDEKLGDWQPIDPAGAPTTLSCHVPGCEVRMNVRLNTQAERAQFARTTRRRRARYLGVTFGVMTAGGVLQWASQGWTPVLVLGALVSLFGTLVTLVLLLMILFGSRMPRHSSESVGGSAPQGYTHTIKTSP